MNRVSAKIEVIGKSVLVGLNEVATFNNYWDKEQPNLVPRTFPLKFEISREKPWERRFIHKLFHQKNHFLIRSSKSVKIRIKGAVPKVRRPKWHKEISDDS